MPTNPKIAIKIRPESATLSVEFVRDMRATMNANVVSIPKE
jgi:hypothetical protein